MKLAQVKELKQRLCSLLGTSEAELRRTSNLFLGPEDLKALSAYGMDVGNHSMSHAFFRSLSKEELITEIVDSRALLASLSGQPVPYLSIPYGNILDANNAITVARESGHRAIFLVHAKSNRFPLASRHSFYRISFANTVPNFS